MGSLSADADQQGCRGSGIAARFRCRGTARFRCRGTVGASGRAPRGRWPKGIFYPFAIEVAMRFSSLWIAGPIMSHRYARYGWTRLGSWEGEGPHAI